MKHIPRSKNNVDNNTSYPIGSTSSDTNKWCVLMQSLKFTVN